MPKYKVHATRVYIGSTTFEVEAENEKSARKIALDEMNSHDMSLQDADEDKVELYEIE